ncbi:MAG: hypothetical protein ACPG7W_00650 [Paracoccaceae bacterium]
MTPLSTMAELRKVDPETTDPAALRVAVALPPGVAIRAQDVRLLITLEATRDAPELNQPIALARMPLGTEEDALVQALHPGHSLHAFRIRASDLDVFRAVRKAAIRADRDGGLSVDADPCRPAGATTHGGYLTVYLNAEETSRYVSMFGDMSLDAGDLADLPTCPS